MVSTAPSVSVSYTINGNSAKANEFATLPMQERICVSRSFKGDT